MYLVLFFLDVYKRQQLVPFAPLAAAIAFFIGKRNYGVDLDRLSALREQAGG
ncbi:hypothetical protein FSO04_38685 [Paraburkholderia madseniana]|uniref:Uncharacterized protein n=2 Tax=Paraburkholderia madseniana TaxID=2599607 RepID=A0A6N6W2D7_9BURK|nr:hypothetical protein FSO04_38685 [Paraburkholderia madseniana]